MLCPWRWRRKKQWGLTVIIDDHVLCVGIPDPVAPGAVLESHGLCLQTLFGHELLIRFAR